jgi:hypothetical protein
MQATSGITFENVGRRFMLYDWRVNAPTSVSSRLQNWIDTDGSVTGFGEPSMIGSGRADTGLWWVVDDRVVHDEQGPLNFIRTNDGPERGLGYVFMQWDADLSAQVRNSVCGNGEQKLPCPAVGHIRHRGPRFAGDAGLPMTANGDVVGPVGGYGWLLELDAGPPTEMSFTLVEVDPATPMLISIAYPVGTTFEFTATTDHCWVDAEHTCSAGFESVASIDDVRASKGNAYHVSSDGVLTFRITMMPSMFVGNPTFYAATWDDPNRSGTWYALDRFERAGIRLPRLAYEVGVSLKASNCGASGRYCARVSASGTSADAVCPVGYTQVSYDKCCDVSGSCVFANAATGLANNTRTIVLKDGDNATIPVDASSVTDIPVSTMNPTTLSPTAATATETLPPSVPPVATLPPSNGALQSVTTTLVEVPTPVTAPNPIVAPVPTPSSLSLLPPTPVFANFPLLTNMWNNNNSPASAPAPINSIASFPNLRGTIQLPAIELNFQYLNNP